MTHQRAIEAGALNQVAIEAATKRIYEDKGDRKGVLYIGWNSEPESVKDQWRADVRISISAYLASLAAEGFVVVPKVPTAEMLKDGAMRTAMNCQLVDTAEKKAANVYADMITAAQQEQNLPAPPKIGGE